MLVSFIVPARNEEKVIGACLDAICRTVSDRGSWECLLIDNGSEDDTVKIAVSKGAKVFSVPEGTISAVRNFGARRAQGQFLAFIDADCVIEKQWLPCALSSCMDPTVGCAGSYPSGPRDKSWVQNAWALQIQRVQQKEDVDWLPSMNILVKREAFFTVNGFNEVLKTCEDVDFCYRLRQKGYRIVSDLNISAVHLGEARTVKEFFRKELWRGQGNILGFLSHRFRFAELPSLVLPLYYLVCIACLPVSAGYLLSGGSYWPLFGNIACIGIPSVLLATRTSIKAGRYRYLLQLSFLYIVYATARAISNVAVRSPRRPKDLQNVKGVH